MTVPVLCIDGPSGAGKGTAAKAMAQKLGWHYLDSGALYRISAIAAERAGLVPGISADTALVALISELQIEFDVAAEPERIVLNGEDVAAEIRLETTGEKASKLAVIPAVREALVAVQHGFAQAPGLVADGRDMGTVIFPQAVCKVFLDASAEERAQRRYKQLKEKGVDANLPRLLEDIQARDDRDRNRSTAPLRPAADAVVIDSTSMDVGQVIERVAELLNA